MHHDGISKIWCLTENIMIYQPKLNRSLLLHHLLEGDVLAMSPTLSKARNIACGVGLVGVILDRRVSSSAVRCKASVEETHGRGNLGAAQARPFQLCTKVEICLAQLH